MHDDRREARTLAALLLLVWISALVLLGALTARAQVAIDDRDVLLDSGDTLETAISRGGVAVVTVNPAEPGTWTAGIGEAVARLPAAGGIVQLACATTYTFASRASWPSATGVDLRGRDDVTIRGCGGASTRVVFAPTNGSYSYMFHLGAPGGTGTNGSDRLRFEDFEVKQTDACTSSCTGESHYLFYSGGLAADVVFERMRLIAVQPVTSDTTQSLSSLVYIDADYGEAYPNVAVKDRMATGWRFVNNYFGTAADGLQVQACESCTYLGNTFTFEGRPVNDNGPVKSVMLRPKQGRGTVISANTFDFGAMDGDAGAGGMNSVGISLAFDFNPTPDDPKWANGGASITGNTFTRMRGYYLFAIELFGVDGISIVGNNFQQGRCQFAATISCTTFEDCVGNGGGLCSPGGSAVAVYFNPQSPVGQSWLRANLIEGNVFNGWDDDDGDQCPIYLGVNGADALEVTSNAIRGNLFRLNDATDDGICGDATKIAANAIGANYVVGATTECVVGQDTTGCGLLYTRASKAIRPARLELPSGSAFPSSPAPTTGECFYLTTAASVGACTAGAGSARSLCCYNGSAWASP